MSRLSTRDQFPLGPIQIISRGSPGNTGNRALTIAPAVAWNSVPRVSVAKYRVPVPPGVTGLALPLYELTGPLVDALHVAAAVLMFVTPVEASFANWTV